jgi:hypothetical protein
MTRSIVKDKQACSEALCLCLKNIDGMVNLFKELLGSKIAIAIFACAEQNSGFSVRENDQ